MKTWQFTLIFLSLLVVTSCSPTRVDYSTSNLTPTAELPMPTAKQSPPSTEWQLSPDGHVWYKESELYGDLFTINKEHPEYVEKYWEDTIRGLWNLNSVSQNKEFLKQFPTDNSLIEYLNSGGGPVENLWIPVIYPSDQRHLWYTATMESVSGAVDLTKIAISIYKPTDEEISNYSPNYATGTRYISYGFWAEEVKIEEITIRDPDTVLLFTFRSDILYDETETLKSGDYTYLALNDQKTPEQNLLAATQLVKSWPLRMQIKDTDEMPAWWTKSNPPTLNLLGIYPTASEFEEITSIDETPLSIR
jgi:hypothetical protein